MRRALAPIAAALLLALSLSASPAGATPVTQLGPPPVAGDCFAQNLIEGTSCFYVIGGIEFHESRHVLRVGETMSVNMANTAWDSYQHPNGYIYRSTTNTMDVPGPFEYVGAPCWGQFYFAGSTSCTLKAIAATGGWRTQGYTLSISSSRPYESGDYYAVVGPDTYEIAGLLRKHNPSSDASEPAPGVTVVVEEIGGDGDKYSQATNLNGRYSILVDKGTWRVRVSDRRFCHETTSGSGCSRTPTTSTPGDREVNFQMPKPVKVSGTVVTKDGEGIADVKVRLSEDGAAPREARSDDDGKYEFEDVSPDSSVTLDSPLKGVCPKIAGGVALDGDGACVQPKRTITVDRDTVVDFERAGCVKTIDFRSSMVATGQCFDVKGPDEWSTDKPFRMNGLDFEPTGTVQFNGTSRVVWFESGTTSVWLPGEANSIAIGTLPPLVARIAFVTDTTVFTQSAGLDEGSSITRSIGGFPIGGKVTITMTAGQSKINGTLMLPVDPGAQFGWSDGGYKNAAGESAEGFSVGFTATTDNAKGFRAMDASFEDGFKSPIFRLKSIKAGYDVPTGVWNLGGSVEPAFLAPNPNVATVLQADRSDPTASAGAGSIEGSISATGVPFFGGEFRGLTAAVDGLNIPVNGTAWLQRLRMGVQMQSLRDGTPFSMTAGVGLSIGPRSSPQSLNVPLLGSVPIKPAERASIDGDFTVSWSRMTWGADNDLLINGTAALKVWDQPIGSGSMSLYPSQGLFGGSLTLGVTDPSGGTLFSMRGRGEVWMDGRANRIYTEGQGNVSVLGVGGNGDVVITGPNPMMAGVCADFFGYRVGATYNYSTGEYTSSETCDLSSFRALKPAPPEPAKAAAAAARTRSFKTSGDEQLLAFEVPIAKGTGAPPVTLKGPGISITSAAAKGVKKGKAMALPNPGKKTVTFFVGKPRKGTYKLSAKGAVRLGTPRFSRPLAEPQVDGELDASRCSPVLSWRAAGTRGQTLRFIEKSGNGAIRELGTSTKAKGFLTITPMPSGGKSEVSAEVLNGATVRATIPLGTYTSEVGPSIPGPRSVSVKTAKKGKAKVSWPAVCGAEAYAVRIGSGKDQILNGTSATVTRGKKASTVTVIALGRGRVPGGSTLVPLPKR
jgi:hypothetical protein